VKGSEIAVGFAGLVLVLGLAVPGGAAVGTVTDFGDSGAAGQLRTLISAAAAGDTILVPPGTIVLTGAAAEDLNVSGDLDINKDLTIVGAGPELTVIDANGVDRAIHVPGPASVVVSGMTLRNGSVDPAAPLDPSGGGVLNNGGTLTLLDVVVEDNYAGGGGGIANFSGTVSLLASTVRFNSSAGITANGGGIMNFDNMTIESSAIHDNVIIATSSSSLGAGLINVDTMYIANSTISGNSTDGNYGGGIYQTPFANALVLRNVTIAKNRSGLGGGGLASVGGKVVMVNTISATNKVGRGGSGRDCMGDIDSLGHNLVQDPAECNLLGTTTGNILGQRARLQALRDNGGPTWTHGLRRVSPAVDAGDATACPALDQRGVVRPRDGDRDGTAVCDIGAYER
jgi:hypothetical protein